MPVHRKRAEQAAVPGIDCGVVLAELVLMLACNVGHSTIYPVLNYKEAWTVFLYN